MYKSLASLAAATMLAAFAASGPTAAAEQSQANGVNNHQNTAEEFTSQRRRLRRGRVIVRGGYWGPRRYWGPGPYAYAYPYGPYAYAHPYPYRRFYGPGISFGVGPFGFHAW